MDLTSQVSAKASGPKSLSISLKLKCILTMQHSIKPAGSSQLNISFHLSESHLFHFKTMRKIRIPTSRGQPFRRIKYSSFCDFYSINSMVFTYKWLYRMKKKVYPVFSFFLTSLKLFIWWQDFERAMGFNFLISCLSFLFLGPWVNILFECISCDFYFVITILQTNKLQYHKTVWWSHHLPKIYSFFSYHTVEKNRESGQGFGGYFQFWRIGIVNCQILFLIILK